MPSPTRLRAARYTENSPDPPALLLSVAVTRIPAVLLAVAILLVYTSYLQHSPVHLHHDEVFFALNAQSIASSGHDLNGRFMPLYFQILPGVWFHPILVYSMAL